MKKGFTLIELLIVVAIIGILATLLLINIASSRERARMSEFKSTANTMNTALVSACDKIQNGNPMVAPTNVAWPVDNISGAITDSPSCSGGLIVSGEARADVIQTGGECVAEFGLRGIRWEGSGC